MPGTHTTRAVTGHAVCDATFRPIEVMDIQPGESS
jgi:hypothetical protein